MCARHETGLTFVNFGLRRGQFRSVTDVTGILGIIFIFAIVSLTYPSYCSHQNTNQHVGLLFELYGTLFISVKIWVLAIGVLKSQLFFFFCHGTLPGFGTSL